MVIDRCILCGEYVEEEMLFLGPETRGVLACKPCLEKTR